MAARKKTATTPATSAVAVRERMDLGALTPEWQQRLAQFVDQGKAVSTGAGGWPFISCKSGVFTVNDAPYSSLDVIVLGAVNENSYYDEEYDGDSSQPPLCFAIGKVGQGDEELAPPADLEGLQSDVCSGCRHNEFGSAPRGRGKACRNSLRVAMIPADDLDPAVLRDVSGAKLRVPPTSLVNFGKFRDVLAGYNLPLFAAVCEMNVQPHAKKNFEVTFTPKAAIRDEEQLEALISRMDEVKRELEAEGPRRTAESEAPARPVARGGARGRKPAAPARGIPQTEQGLPTAGRGKAKPAGNVAAEPASQTAAASGDKPKPRRKF